MLKSVPRVPAHAGENVVLPVAVADFLNGLRRVPVGEWADAARTAEHQGTAADASRGAAAATLRRIVAGMPGIAKQTQRRVRNLVEVAEGCVDERVTGAMRRTALNAALALATRDALGEDVFAQLYAPFDALIPLPEAEIDVSAAWDAAADTAAVARAS